MNCLPDGIDTVQLQKFQGLLRRTGELNRYVRKKMVQHLQDTGSTLHLFGSVLVYDIVGAGVWRIGPLLQQVAHDQMVVGCGCNWCCCYDCRCYCCCCPGCYCC